MKRIFFLTLFIITGFEVIKGQQLLFTYNFDDCSFEDAATAFPGITPGGNPDCVCGLGVNSVELDGQNDFLTLSDQLNIHLDSNFTFDFYFWMFPQVGEIDIFSLRSGCNSLDSLMSLRYFSSTDELTFELGSNVNNYFVIKDNLSKSSCWHRFTLVKFNLEYYVYFDNKLVRKIVSRETIKFTKLSSLAFANSPCNLSNGAKKFNGRLDDIKLYKRAFSELEIISDFKFPDRIVTENTTIFKGESIQLNTGNTCANQITWTPDQTLDLQDLLNPTATPEVSTTYQVLFNNGSCVSSDSVRIFVADKEKLDCDNLLLPKAFTPNNDGLNDSYGISNTFLVESIDFFEIYNRSGAKVWETNNISERWDGNINGQLATGGMYIYKINYTCNGKERFNVDEFTLLR